MVKTEELDKTPNKMIFIEKDTPLSETEIDKKLQMLEEACLSEDDNLAREALRKAVPTFKTPEEVNKDAEEKVLSKHSKNTSEEIFNKAAASEVYNA